LDGVHYGVHDDSNLDRVYAEFRVRWLQFSHYSEQSTTELTYDPDSERRDSDLWTEEFYFSDVLRPCDLERQSFLFHLGRHDIDDSSVSDEAERFRK